MDKKKLLRAIGIILVFVMIAGSLACVLPTNRIEPENPLAAEADEMKIQLVESSGTGMSSDENASGSSDEEQPDEQSQEMTEQQEAPEQPPKEEQEPEDTEESDNPEQSEEENPDETKDGDGEVTEGDGDVPSDGGDQGTDQPGEGDNTGEEEPGLVTDLYSRMITVSELDNHVLHFYAYYSDEEVDANIKVNYKHKSDRGNGTYLTADDINYKVTLQLGVNYITIYYTDAEGERNYARFVITYEADKADKDTPVVGDRPPIIETGLDNWNGPIKTTEFTLTVRARTWDNRQIYSDHIEVMMDGKRITDPTGNSTYEYTLYFPVPVDGDVTKHTITVLAWDDEGNSRFIMYNVEYHYADEGAVIGTVEIILDATTIGCGILDIDTVELVQGETAAHAVARMLENNGYEIGYEGTLSNGFYLHTISRGDAFSRVQIDPRLTALIERDGISITSPCSRDSLSEHDFTKGSGWMYSINGTLYPGKGMSGWKLNDGDTVYIRFTLAYGKDIGGIVSGNGALTNYCGKWIDETFIPLEHDFQESKRVEPTGTEAGYIEYTCTKCHEQKQEELPATGVVDPTPDPEPNPTPEPNPDPEPEPEPTPEPTPDPDPEPPADPSLESTPELTQDIS